MQLPNLKNFYRIFFYKCRIFRNIQINIYRMFQLKFAPLLTSKVVRICEKRTDMKLLLKGSENLFSFKKLQFRYDFSVEQEFQWNIGYIWMNGELYFNVLTLGKYPRYRIDTKELFFIQLIMWIFHVGNCIRTRSLREIWTHNRTCSQVQPVSIFTAFEAINCFPVF